MKKLLVILLCLIGGMTLVLLGATFLFWFVGVAKSPGVSSRTVLEVDLETPASTITGSGRAGSPGHRSDCKVASTAPPRTKWSSGLRSQRRIGVALSIKRLSFTRLSFKRPFK